MLQNINVKIPWNFGHFFTNRRRVSDTTVDFGKTLDLETNEQENFMFYLKISFWDKPKYPKLKNGMWCINAHLICLQQRIFRYFTEFKCGCKSTNDTARSGRPIEPSTAENTLKSSLFCLEGREVKDIVTISDIERCLTKTKRSNVSTIQSAIWWHVSVIQICFSFDL